MSNLSLPPLEENLSVSEKDSFKIRMGPFKKDDPHVINIIRMIREHGNYTEEDDGQDDVTIDMTVTRAKGVLPEIPKEV